MANLNILRGFKDIILDEAIIFKKIIETSYQKAKLYNFKPSYFPILEANEVYIKTLGNDSDIVTKEMYSFSDRSENQVTMRPEFTAGIARSIISNSLYDKMPLKFFSYGPLFRYERPQRGRYRQFNQINFEYYGNDSFYAEAEIFLLINDLITSFGLQEQVTLEINYLGDNNLKNKFKDDLVKYLEKYKKDLSPDSQKRLVSNPLRILDSKDKNDQKILIDAPSIIKYYSSEDNQFLDNIKNILTENKIKYIENNKLVRGLDYYNKTVFEVTTSLLGSQNAIFAGGRYDNLLFNMGGKATPAIGFAGGIERLYELTKEENINNVDVAIIYLEKSQQKYAFNITQNLRKINKTAELIYSGNNMTKKLKKANNINPNYVVIIGEDEIENNKIRIRNFKNGQESLISLNELNSFFPQ